MQLEECYKSYKNNNSTFKYNDITYQISDKLIGIVYNYRIFPIMSCIGIGASAFLKMDNIILLTIIRALCGLLTALSYKYLMLYFFSKELNK